MRNNGPSINNVWLLGAVSIYRYQYNATSSSTRWYVAIHIFEKFLHSQSTLLSRFPITLSGFARWIPRKVITSSCWVSDNNFSSSGISHSSQSSPQVSNADESQEGPSSSTRKTVKSKRSCINTRSSFLRCESISFSFLILSDTLPSFSLDSDTHDVTSEGRSSRVDAFIMVPEVLTVTKAA